MSRYTTTNIRLLPERFEQLKLQARRERKTVAQLVREAVDTLLGYSNGAAPVLDSDPFWKVIGLGDGRESDSAEEHDHYLYGWPKQAGRKSVRGHQRPRGPGGP